MEPEAGGESETGKEGKKEEEEREGEGRRRREAVAAPWRRSRSRRGMERRRLVGGMALLLLQALPSPLSARAEPPQVRGRGRPGPPGGLGIVEAWLERSEGVLIEGGPTRAGLRGGVGV